MQLTKQQRRSYCWQNMTSWCSGKVYNLIRIKPHFKSLTYHLPFVNPPIPRQIDCKVIWLGVTFLNYSCIPVPSIMPHIPEQVFPILLFSFKENPLLISVINFFFTFVVKLIFNWDSGCEPTVLHYASGLVSVNLDYVLNMEMRYFVED